MYYALVLAATTLLTFDFALSKKYQALAQARQMQAIWREAAQLPPTPNSP